MKFARTTSFFAVAFTTLAAFSGSAQAALVPSYHDYASSGNSSNCDALQMDIKHEEHSENYINLVGSVESQCWGDYQHAMAAAKQNLFLSASVDQALAQGLDAHNAFVAKVEHAHQMMADERAAQEKQQQSAQADFNAHIADLKAKHATPQTLQEAAAYYGAENGQSLISNPLLRPDGKEYTMLGVIDDSSDVDAGVLVLKGIQTNPLDRENFGGLTGYAKIKFKDASAIPANARVGVAVAIVGRYDGNSNYSTVVGAKKTMPVMEAQWALVGAAPAD